MRPVAGQAALARLRAVDRALQDTDWLCAGRFTAADISVGYALLLAAQLGFDAEFTPAVAAYWARLHARPGFQAAKASERRPESVSAAAWTQSSVSCCEAVSSRRRG